MVRPVSYLYQQVVGSRPDAILAPLGSRAPVNVHPSGHGESFAVVVCHCGCW